MVHKIKEALRVLFSPNYISEISTKQVFKKAVKKNVKNFVQIGSNDGKKNDPIFEYINSNNWHGILVEPDLQNYQKLIENYKGAKNLIFENVGIGPDAGVLTFYKLRDVLETEPEWYDQIGSFDKETFIKNVEVIPGLLNRMQTEQIQVITFDQLLQKNNLSSIDILHTDTEGYDYKILKSIDFKRYSIKIVFFETEWMTQYEVREIIARLKSFGFKIYRHGIDHVGFLIK